MRKKCSRLEDDNDSLAMQLKKMATKARGSTCTYSTKLPKKSRRLLSAATLSLFFTCS